MRLGITGNSKCPVTVLQVLSSSVNGIPMVFSIPGESTGEIFTDTPLEIVFAEMPNCAESSKWGVFVDNDLQKAYVGIGGPEDHPGQEPLNGTFIIQNRGYRPYNLAFCVKGLPTCFVIGRFDDPAHAERGRRLVLTDNEPFDVVFTGDGSDCRIRSVV